MFNISALGREPTLHFTYKYKILPVALQTREEESTNICV